MTSIRGLLNSPCAHSWWFRLVHKLTNIAPLSLPDELDYLIAPCIGFSFIAFIKVSHYTFLGLCDKCLSCPLSCKLNNAVMEGTMAVLHAVVIPINSQCRVLTLFPINIYREDQCLTLLFLQVLLKLLFLIGKLVGNNQKYIVYNNNFEDSQCSNVREQNEEIKVTNTKILRLHWLSI